MKKQNTITVHLLPQDFTGNTADGADTPIARAAKRIMKGEIYSTYQSLHVSTLWGLKEKAFLIRNVRLNGTLVPTISQHWDKGFDSVQQHKIRTAIFQNHFESASVDLVSEK